MLSFTIVAAEDIEFTLVDTEDCEDFCSDEGFDSGDCREADEDRETICYTDEEMYGFDHCITGSLERCCCSNEEEEEETVEDTTETNETIEETTEETTTSTKYLNIEIGNVYLDKNDLPKIIFFELLLVVLILAIFVAFKKSKRDDDFL